MWDGIVQVFNIISEYVLWVNMLLGLVLVFVERKNPGTLWAWLLLMFFVPVLGFLLYLYFGQDLRKTKMFKNKQADDMVQIAEIQKQHIDKEGAELADPALRVTRIRQECCSAAAKR